MVATTREGVFYTGDGGVKFALTAQFARGGHHADLRLPAEPWVEDLWSRGLYPLDRPFAYQIEGRRYVKDPVFFSLLTAPLLAALGSPGLYVVPLLSLWAVWLAFLLLARRAGMGPETAALALAALVFASPLTIYGAIYWEHTLAVALAFGGIAILATEEGEGAPPWPTAGAGALVALSAWFRSEHAWLVAVMAALALASRRVGLGLRRAPLLAGLLVPMVALAAVNAAIYGDPLGAHAFQVRESLPLAVRVSNAVATQGRLLRLLAEYVPVAVPALGLAISVMARGRRGGADRADRLLAWASGVYVALLPAILPRPETGGDGGKQWGPRFLLVAVPLLLALAARSAPRLAAIRARGVRAAVAGAFLAGIVLGAHRNAWVGSRELSRDYSERMLPLLEFLRSDPARIVAASEQFAAQEMMALAGDRRFFFVKSAEDLERLGVAARRHGQPRFLFLSDQTVQGSGPVREGGETFLLRVLPIARYGWRLVAHEVRLDPLTPPVP
jgi:hypothetical protein